MAGVKGRSGKGSGGAGRGQGRKRSRVTLERGAKVVLTRTSRDGQILTRQTTYQIIEVGGKAGHAQQIILRGATETITLVVKKPATI